MRIVLHIGLEKTGTTSIQAHCQRHAQALRAQGILYPSDLGPGNHVDLATAFAAFELTGDMRLRAGVGTEAELASFGAQVVARLKRQVARARPRCLLLSNEHLSSRCYGAEIGRLRDMLAGFSDDVRVLVYLRRQDRAVLSLYSSYLKGQGTRDLAHMAAGTPWLDYRALLARWADAFGRDRLVVRRFPPPRGSLIEDFSAAAGLPPLPEVPDDTRANRSLDPRQRGAAGAAQRHPADRPRRRAQSRPDRAAPVHAGALVRGRPHHVARRA